MTPIPGLEAEIFHKCFLKTVKEMYTYNLDIVGKILQVQKESRYIVNIFNLGYTGEQERQKLIASFSIQSNIFASKCPIGRAELPP